MRGKLIVGFDITLSDNWISFSYIIGRNLWIYVGAVPMEITKTNPSLTVPQSVNTLNTLYDNFYGIVLSQLSVSCQDEFNYYESIQIVTRKVQRWKFRQIVAQYHWCSEVFIGQDVSTMACLIMVPSLTQEFGPWSIITITSIPYFTFNL